MPHSLPSKIIFITLCLSFYLILCIYSASLASFLSVIDSEIPFDSLEDFKADNSYKIDFVNDSFYTGQGIYEVIYKSKD